MPDYGLFVLIVCAPILLGVLLRVNASHLFFSIMTGELLARYFGEEAESALHTMFNSDAVTIYAHLLILSLPVLLTGIVLKNSVSRSRAVINIFPLIVAGVVFAAFAIPLLPSELHREITATPTGSDFVSSNGAIIGFVVLFQLVILWLTSRGEGHKKRRKH